LNQKENGQMILSHGRGYLFLHIPKTGGTALTLALEARAMKDDLIISDTPKGRARSGRLAGIKTKGRLWKHSTLCDLEGLVGPADLDGLFILTMVRNPWDRVVSLYHWLRGQTFPHALVGLAKAHDFSGFLNHAQTRMLLSAWPARAYVQDRAGMDRCRLFIRLEHLEADITPFEAHLGFRVTPLARVNMSERVRDWRGYYTDSDAALLGAVCAEDIAQFGYRFDPA
jgi:hypothetical protein